MRFSLLLLLMVAQLSAATRYVRKDGNNANTGSADNAGGAWLTVQKAAETVTAGDIVYVRQGTYTEWVTNINSGTAGNQIIFEGEKSGSDWLTIIDPSTNLSTGWVTAPEAGSGIYKRTGLPFPIRELTIDSKRVGFVFTNGDMSAVISEAYKTNITTGFGLMALASTATVTTKVSNVLVEFWDGIEALYCSTGSVCYLKLRDGSDPSSLTIRGSPNKTAEVSSDLFWPAWLIKGVSYITLTNLAIRGAHGGIFVSDATTRHIVISSNNISDGYAQITMGTGPYLCTVTGNTMSDNFYGYTDLGAWEAGTSSTYYTREILYGLSKFLMGNDSTFGNGVVMINTGISNVIAFNRMTNGLGNGVSIRGYVDGPMMGTVVASNTISQQVSTGIIFHEGQTDTRVFGNSIFDCNTNLRWHHMDTSLETNRTIYIYRNLAWLPAGIGDHIFCHFNNSTPDDFRPTFYLYHNSFSGGRAGISMSSLGAPSGGLSNCYVLNNIISGSDYVAAELQFWTNATMIGSFDYNLINPVTYPSSSNPAWYGSHNVSHVSDEWDAADKVLALVAGSLAVNAATNLASLPSIGTVQVGPYWDIGALEYGGSPTPAVIGPGKSNKKPHP